MLEQTLAEVDQRDRRLRMIGAESLALQREHALEQRLRLLDTAHRLDGIRELACRRRKRGEETRR